MIFIIYRILELISKVFDESYEDYMQRHEAIPTITMFFISLEISEEV
jgi:hypothetical protein